jgi:hypothetical protein
MSQWRRARRCASLPGVSGFAESGSSLTGILKWTSPSIYRNKFMKETKGEGERADNPIDFKVLHVMNFWAIRSTYFICTLISIHISPHGP